MKEEIILVIDANVWISYLISQHPEPYRAVLNHPNCTVYICDELVEEIRDVAKRDKFRNIITADSVEKLLKTLDELAKRISIVPDAQYDECVRDKDDAYLLALACAVEANYLITGDKDLLSLEYFKQTKILTLSAFIREQGIEV